MKTSIHKFVRGFTLVELLVVMAIMAVLMTMAGNVLQTAGKGRSVESAVQTIEGVVREARATAMGNDAPVRVVIVSDKDNRSKTSPHLRVIHIMQYTSSDRSSGDYDGSKLDLKGRWKTISTVVLPAQVYFSPYYSSALGWSKGEKGSMIGTTKMPIANLGEKHVYFFEFDEKGRFVAPFADVSTQTRPQRIVLMMGNRAEGRNSHQGIKPQELDTKDRPVGAKGIVLWPNGETSRLRTLDQTIEEK